MKYAIQINASPYGAFAGQSAYRFVKALLAAQHQVLRIFFYQEGIYHAFRYNLPPEDEVQLTQQWSTLAMERDIDLVVCISAAQRRGLLCEDEARRQSGGEGQLADGFRIAGLGQWLEASLQADRTIVFG
ncbi:MAG: hypothetical protein RL563_2159 [Pseudomonadota bacterium]|jgi:tRNA 2-thiouridine synthesizing protein D